MKKNSHLKKLTLSRETISLLVEGQGKWVVGGNKPATLDYRCEPTNLDSEETCCM